MYSKLKDILTSNLSEIRSGGLYKDERIITSPQGADIKVPDGDVINFCANNYLGLSNNPEIIKAAQEGMNKYGYGLSSVRFICGTQNIHKELERKVSEYLKTEDTILYSSCFDANGGLFEGILTEEDAIISDELNHASIIDGVRLCKAKRFRFKNSDMNDLEAKLQEAQNARVRMIATDGVFSMDGYIAKLNEICKLAEKYDALVMVDDSHATGFIGESGRGTPEYNHVMEKVDVVTSTFGKALGGASGGFTSGRKEIIEYLRQKSRPYLFSNTVAPAIICATLKTIELLSTQDDARKRLMSNTNYFRSEIRRTGFEIKEGTHPIVPIMLGDAKLASGISKDMLVLGIYVIGFSYPVVPKEQARIRVQISAAHTKDHLDRAIEAFIKVGKKYGVI